MFLFTTSFQVFTADDFYVLLFDISPNYRSTRVFNAIKSYFKDFNVKNIL